MYGTYPEGSTRLRTEERWDQANARGLNCARISQSLMGLSVPIQDLLETKKMLCQVLNSRRQKMTALAVIFVNITVVVKKINMKRKRKETIPFPYLEKDWNLY